MVVFVEDMKHRLSARPERKGERKNRAGDLVLARAVFSPIHIENGETNFPIQVQPGRSAVGGKIGGHLALRCSSALICFWR